MPTVSQIIQRYARQYDIGPWAAMAVAMGEGGLRRGAVGDSGTSFGPFQLHIGGALPRRYWNNRAAAAAFANSAQGIEYAIRQMAQSGAAGLTGRRAINAIVRGFERPADPDASVQRAIEYWNQLRAGGVPQGMQARSAMTPQAVGGQIGGAKQVFGLLSGSSFKNTPGVGKGLNPMLQTAIMAKMAGQPTVNYGRVPQMPAGMGSVEIMRALIEEAQRRGLAVRENPLVDPVERVHTENSWHYRNFGRSGVGRAADISGGNQAQLMGLIRWARRQWGFSPFQEIFFDPWGAYNAGSGYRRQGIGGHGTHAHFAL